MSKSDGETTSTRKCCTRVNPRLLPGKLYYLTQFGCWVCLHPFFTVYYRSLGMSARQAGIIQAVGEFFTILSPIGGLIGDKLKKPKAAWIASILGQFAFGMIIGLAFRPDANFQWTKSYCHCNETGLHWIMNVSNITVDCGGLKTWEGSWSKAAIFVVLASFLYFVYGSVCGLGDAYVLSSLDNPSHYGQQRAWGSLAWAFISAAVGIFTDMISTCGHVNYDVHYFTFAVCLWLSILCALFVKPKGNVQVANVDIKRSLHMLLSQPDVCVYFVGIFFIGIDMVVVESFLLFFLEDLGGTQSVMGIAIFMRGTSQIAVFFLSGWIVKRLGYHGSIAFSLIVFCVRFVAYTFLTNPWYVLLIEPIHGFTFGLSLATTALYIGITAPPELQSGAQTIGYAIRCGLGKGLANLVSGFVYHRFGAIVTFRAIAIVSAIGAIVFWSLHVMVKRRAARMVKNVTEEDEEEKKFLLDEKDGKTRVKLYSYSDHE